MSRGRQLLGRRGEALAEGHLVARGYRILARNFRCRFGEVDLVADEGGVVVFVEVKTRRSARAGTGAEAVGAVKRRRLVAAARYFLAVRGLTAALCRFDVVSLDVGAEGTRVDLVRDAFTAP